MTPAEINIRIAEALAQQDSRGIRLRLASTEDSAFILSLRNNKKLGKHLSATSSELSDQKDWMRKYSERCAKGTEHYFVIEEGNVPLGTIRMYDYRLEERSCCCGSWIITPDANPSCAPFSIILVYDLIFRAARFLTLRFDVRKENLTVLAFHRRTGAKEVSQSQADFFFRISLQEYESVVRPKLLSFHAKVSRT